MANYNITLSDGVTIVTVNEAAISNDYSVPLVGQNATTYGDDVAAGSLRSLENFASTLSPDNNTTLGPSVTALKGQLWFDTGNNVLNVNTGSAGTPVWENLAPTAQGSTTNSVLRWTGTAWAAEERVRVSDVGVLSLLDAGTDAVTMQHNGTDLLVDGTSTTADISFDNFSGGVELHDAMSLTIFSTGDTQNTAINQNGTDFTIAGTSTADLDVTGFTNVRLNAAVALQERAGAPGDVAGYGQLYTKTSDSGLYYKSDSAGEVRLDVTAGGTVTATNGAVNRVAVFSTGTNINGDASFEFDGTDVRVDTGGGFVAENGAGAIAIRHGGAAANITTSGTSVINIDAPIDVAGDVEGQSLTIVNTNTFEIRNGATTTFDVNGASALNIQGMNESDTGLNLEDGTKITFEDLALANPISINNTGAGGSSAQLEFTTPAITPGVWFKDGIDVRIYDSSNTDSVALYHDGSWFNIEESTGTNTGIRLRAQTAEESIVAFANGSVTTYYNGTQAMVTQSGSSSGETSRGGVWDTTGTQRNVGFNETPQVTISSGRSIARSDIGKMLIRTGTGTFAINCPNDATIPTGATLLILNDNSTGTLTITATSTLDWVDGATFPPPNGTRTLAANGIATIRKRDGTTWQIWGTGIS